MALVYVYRTDTPGDFLKVLADQEMMAEYLLVCCHGDDDPRGIVFGEFATSIDTIMLDGGNLPPDVIAARINLPDRIVVNTGCGCGQEPMAEAFLKGGLKAYIGAVDALEGSSAIMFAISFFYTLFTSGCSPKDAWRKAASFDEETALFAYYDSMGVCHRVE
ncbi:MAG: hypothetical protein QGH20_06840 [Candidatus Latescibacteria bacterium]|jgi:hypothetical protein|nr:hypothetical protein [Candidatus Latescibacterota bacterium]